MSSLSYEHYQPFLPTSGFHIIMQQNLVTYLFWRSIPNNDAVSGVEKILDNARSHDSKTQETELECGGVDVFVLE